MLKRRGDRGEHIRAEEKGGGRDGREGEKEREGGGMRGRGEVEKETREE